MENQQKNFAKEKMNYSASKKTNIITANDIAAEIMVLLDDFFCGMFKINKTEILMELDDNKVFRLSIAEVI